MILPNEPGARYEVVLNYLSGTMPEEELSAIDAELLSNDESLALFEESSADLMDAYADGVLSRTLAAKVEELIARQPAAGQRLTFARALERLRDGAAMRSSTPAGPVRVEKERRVGFRAFRWQMAAGLAVLLILGGVGIVVGRRSGERDVNRANVAGVTPRGGVASPAYTVILSPVVLRGGARRGISVPEGTGSVRMQIVLPEESKATVCGVRVTNAAGVEVRAASGLAVRSLDGQAYVEMVMPASELPPGAYRIAVSDQVGTPITSYELSRVK